MTLPDLASLDRATAYRITRLARLLRVDLVRTLGRHDLSPEQYFTLYRLHEQDGRSHRELTDPTLDDRANITRIVDGLQKRGWVRRQKDDEDRRVTRVWLTRSGRSLFEELIPVIQGERGRIFEGLSDADWAALDRVLDRVEANLTGD